LEENLEERKRFLNSVDRQQRFPLFWAIAKGNIEVVELLLANGADPTKTDKSLESAIHAAATNCNNQQLTLMR